tara:strand:+ start:269 stop:673 length:405 start_codon:yes stop_codon:yes gene_type:complete
MSRGVYKCVVKIEYKSKDHEVQFVPPDCFGKTFEELGIHTGGQLCLVELKNFENIGASDMEDDDEGGEEEHEEMEEELEEGDLEKQEEQNNNNPDELKDKVSEKGENDNKIEENNAISPEALVSQNLPTAIAPA